MRGQKWLTSNGDYRILVTVAHPNKPAELVSLLPAKLSTTAEEHCDDCLGLKTTSPSLDGLEEITENKKKAIVEEFYRLREKKAQALEELKTIEGAPASPEEAAKLLQSRETRMAKAEAAKAKEETAKAPWRQRPLSVEQIEETETRGRASIADWDHPKHDLPHHLHIRREGEV